MATVDEILDLTTSTLKKLGRYKWTDLSFALTEYVWYPQVMRRDRVQFQSDGVGMQFNIRLKNDLGAKGVELFETDDYNQMDSMTTANIPWKHINANFVIERREPMMNAGESRVFDFVKVKRDQCMGGLIENCETWAYATPSTTQKVFYGLPYWVVKWPTGYATGGFYGCNPTGFSDVAGKDTALTTDTYAAYRNWTAQYTNFTKADVITKMKHAARKTAFKAPIAAPDYRVGALRRTVDVNLATLEAFEDLRDQQNDNLTDLSGGTGEVMFMRNPVRYIPKLDEDTSNPIYILNWQHIRMTFLEQDYMVEDTHKVGNAHNCVATDYDMSCQSMCENRREQAVLSQTGLAGVTS